MNRFHRHGFTLVEAVIATAVIAVTLAVLVPILRERESQRLQALADSEPWEVFKLRAKPTKKNFSANEQVVIQCEVENPTKYALNLPKALKRFVLIFGDTDCFTDLAEWTGLNSVIRDAPIEPEGSVTFEVRFGAGRLVGSAEIRIAYWDGQNRRILRETHPLVFLELDSPGLDRNAILSGLLPKDEERFQSNLFRLIVDESVGEELPTFDELFTAIKRLE